jgi:hypothetical protein
VSVDTDNVCQSVREILTFLARQAEALEATLEDEKRLLASKLKERDHMIRCDAVYAKITARPKSKEELKE